MGAEVMIVIAIDIGTPLRGPEQLGSPSGITFQALALAGDRRVREQKLRADVLLEPDLGDLSMMDDPAMAGAIAIGERAARAAEAELRPFADRSIGSLVDDGRLNLPIEVRSHFFFILEYPEDITNATEHNNLL